MFRRKSDVSDLRIIKRGTRDHRSSCVDAGSPTRTCANRPDRSKPFIVTAAQPSAKDFSGGRAGDGSYEHVFTRSLETRETAAQADLVELLVTHLQRRRLDESHDPGAEAFVGNADHG